MDLAATIVLNGLTLAALYFIVASGFSLIFGLMRVVNMAHGAMYLVAGYVGYSVFEPLYDRDVWYAWYVGLAAGVAAALGAASALVDGPCTDPLARSDEAGLPTKVVKAASSWACES